MDRIEEIKKRLSEMATPGSWYFRHGNGSLILDKDGIIVDEPLHAMDAIFIANAPSDIEFLLHDRDFYHAMYQDAEAHATQLMNDMERLQQEFASYKETAEETAQCYNDSHSDGWVFEEALRRIAKKSLFVPHNAGSPNGHEQQKIALEALEKVWNRRIERSKVVRV